MHSSDFFVVIVLVTAQVTDTREVFEYDLRRLVTYRVWPNYAHACIYELRSLVALHHSLKQRFVNLRS